MREVLRHYTEFEHYCTQEGKYFIEHKGLTLSFLDLQGALANLSPRKKEAILLNVIYDYKQKEVAELMGITTVSVGQYVEQGMIQLCQTYFGEDEHVRVVSSTRPELAAGDEPGVEADIDALDFTEEVEEDALLEESE